MRDIVYHSDFADQIALAEIEFPRIEDFISGVKFKLQRNPQFGEKVRDNPPIWFIALPDVFEVSAGLTYSFDDKTVCLLSIWVGKKAAGQGAIRRTLV